MISVAHTALAAAVLAVVAAAGPAAAGGPPFGAHGPHDGRLLHPGVRHDHGHYHGCYPPWRDRSFRRLHQIFGQGVRRHHGLGEGAYLDPGVKRFHGLGSGFYYFPWVRDTEAPPRRDQPPPAPRPQAPPQDPDVDDGGNNDAEPAGRPALRELRRADPWALLRRGDARAALARFAVLALRAPDDAAPKVGYSLAAAALNRHDRAAWAMRRAVETDASVLRRLAPLPTAEPLVRALAERYRQRAAGSADGDAPFMAAALRALLGEAEAAVASTEADTDPGDVTASAR